MQVLFTFNDNDNEDDDDTPEPLCNTVRYNTVLDITWIRIGPQMAI